MNGLNLVAELRMRMRKFYTGRRIVSEMDEDVGMQSFQKNN
jgi:hypothetical protein